MTSKYKIEIIKITQNEVKQLQDISIQTFVNTYTKGNTKENMSYYLKNSLSSEKLKVELNNPKSDFYFAKKGTKNIGYLKLNFGDAQGELKNENSLEMQRIYVLDEFKGMKVGQSLLEKTIEIAKAKRIDFIWVSVWNKNAKAIEFYNKMGFVTFDEHIFKFGTERHTDFMMKLVVEY